MTSRVSYVHSSQPRIGVGTSSHYGDSMLGLAFQQRRKRTPGRRSYQSGGGIGKRL